MRSGAPTSMPYARSPGGAASSRAARPGSSRISPPSWTASTQERRDAYLAAAPRAAERVVFTGGLEHRDLPLLLPACEAQVVPSTFPEAFGMVAAEAACCGALPLSASHSGLAEVTATLAEAVEPGIAALLSFERGRGRWRRSPRS